MQYGYLVFISISYPLQKYPLISPSQNDVRFCIVFLHASDVSEKDISEEDISEEDISKEDISEKDISEENITEKNLSGVIMEL